MNAETLMKFVGRTDVFAKQLDSGAYIPIKKPITIEHLKLHLDGSKTLGTYVIQEDGLIKFAVIDIDGNPNKLATLKRLAMSIRSMFKDFDTAIEFSGRRGYHIWIFCHKPETPAFMRNLIKSRLNKKGYRNIEIYPKQNEVSGKGYGNLVKLPCGIHKKSGKRSELIEV